MLTCEQQMDTETQSQRGGVIVSHSLRSNDPMLCTFIFATSLEHSILYLTSDCIWRLQTAPFSK